MEDDLLRLGDALEAAVAGEISGERNNGDGWRHEPGGDNDNQEVDMTTPTPTPFRRRLFVAGAVVGGVLAAGTGVAAAAGLFGADEVASGLPGGAFIFGGTEPECTATDDPDVFDCVLGNPPARETAEEAGAAVVAKAEAEGIDPDDVPVPDYQGRVDLFVDAEDRIAGGCRGLDQAGLHWTCYVGERAVAEDILAADLLGQVLDAPTRG